jgi:CII-binding regulator of phage lambda lysogenization HflD
MKIEFINPVNQANQLGKNNSVDVFLMSIMNLAQANPAILDTVDFDEIARYKADILQIDPKLIKNASKVDEERQARQQQMAQQQEMIDANTEAQTLATMKQAGV